MIDKKNFDIGFSFQTDDIQIVNQVYSALIPNYKIFFAPEKQEHLFMQDQADQFANIFKSTKLNFIFLGPKYGKTKWTRFEERVIKERTVDGEWDSTGIIKLEKDVGNLVWYPPNNGYIRYYAEDFESIIAIMRYAADKAGVSFHKESLADLAKRKKQEEEISKKVSNYPGSPKALEDAENEVRLLFDLVEKELTLIKSDFRSTVTNKIIDFAFLDSTYIDVTSGRFRLVVEWKNYSSTFLDNSCLLVTILGPKHPNAGLGDNEHQLYSKTFDVGINRSMNFVWKLRNGSEEYSTHQLTELIVKELIERAYYS